MSTARNPSTCGSTLPISAQKIEPDPATPAIFSPSAARATSLCGLEARGARQPRRPGASRRRPGGIFQALASGLVPSRPCTRFTSSATASRFTMARISGNTCQVLPSIFQKAGRSGSVRRFRAGQWRRLVPRACAIYSGAGSAVTGGIASSSTAALHDLKTDPISQAQAGAAGRVPEQPGANPPGGAVHRVAHSFGCARRRLWMRFTIRGKRLSIALRRMWSATTRRLTGDARQTAFRQLTCSALLGIWAMTCTWITSIITKTSGNCTRPLSRAADDLAV